MAAPVATVRQTPAGKKLQDGYQCLITFEADPDVALWEKSIQPPGFDGGEKIDQTTMHNTEFKTFSPQTLIEVTDSQTTAAFDPRVYTQIRLLINVETTITITFPNGDTLAFFGYLQKFEVNEMSQGEQPEATVTIVATNKDSLGIEQAPVLTEFAGTGT